LITTNHIRCQDKKALLLIGENVPTKELMPIGEFALLPQCPVAEVKHGPRGAAWPGCLGAKPCRSSAPAPAARRLCEGFMHRSVPDRRFAAGIPRVRLLFATTLLLGMAVALPLPAASGQIRLELNRLEDQGSSCRAYLVIANPTEQSYSGFKLDLVVFDRSGTIIRRLALELAPLRAAKTTVKVFDIADTGCGTIGSMLVNDVLDCRDSGGNESDCVQRVSTSSKLAAVSLSK
jgi:hypothetical protein